MVVYHANSDTVILDGITFNKVNNPYKLFSTETLFEITIENGIQIEHQITEYNDLKYLVKEGVNIYREA